MASDMKEAKTPREAKIIQANIQEELEIFSEGIRNTLIHEVQHAIQDFEGFAKGTSPEAAAKLNPAAPVSTYMRHAGEVEARNVEQRAVMSDERRRNTPPSETEDVSRHAQIVRYSLMDNAEKRDVIIPALQRIVDGSEEEVLTGIRNDLEQYGGTNDITLVWGNEKKGIYHIAYRRGMNTLMHVLDAVADGELTKYVAGNKTVHLVKDGFEAILSLDENGKKKTWLLTGWEIDKPDAVGEFYSNSDATQNTPTFSRCDLGAGLNNIIAQNREKSSENQGNIRWSVAGEDENLIAVHNLSEQKLRGAIKLGALPVPSIAIINADKSDFTDYGRITLIADKSAIDPKNRKNKVYDSDVYSPRRPIIERVFSDEEFDRALKIISPYEMNEPDSALSIQHLVRQHRYRAIDRDFEEDLKDNDAVKAWYTDTRQGEEKFEDWWQRVATPALDLNPKERIFDGFTNAGNRRYLPANLETIVRLITKQVKNGEGTHWGFGSYRAAVAKQFKSISEIQKNRDKIISGDEYKALKDEIQKDIDTLESEMEKAKLEAPIGVGTRQTTRCLHLSRETPTAGNFFTTRSARTIRSTKKWRRSCRNFAIFRHRFSRRSRRGPSILTSSKRRWFPQRPPRLF